MDKTIAFVAGCVTLILAFIIITTSFNFQNKQKAMVEMVSKGADPQAVACAVDGVNNMNQQVCNALAINKSKGN